MVKLYVCGVVLLLIAGCAASWDVGKGNVEVRKVDNVEKK